MGVDRLLRDREVGPGLEEETPRGAERSAPGDPEPLALAQHGGGDRFDDLGPPHRSAPAQTVSQAAQVRCLSLG